VIATIGFNKDGITITNNGGSSDYTFTNNGDFTFTYKDIYGPESATASVNWIMDKDFNYSG
jgi:hypothetical protein